MGDYQVSTTNVELELRSPTLVDLNQITTKHALEKAQNTQQSTKDWLK